MNATALPAHPEVEAIAEILFLAAFADDELGPEERTHFRSAILKLTDVSLEPAAFDALVEKLSDALATQGRAARLATIRERLVDEKRREMALTMAIRLTAADGIIRTAERELILEAAEALGIDGDRAADLVAKAGR
jgi:uncharacterized tellurite resistance protein B-like protein